MVFHPPKPSPSGLLLKAEQAAQRVLASASGEPLTPANYAAYFEQFYADIGSNPYDQYDACHMKDLLFLNAYQCEFQFRTAAARFQLIPEQGQRPVFVQWGEDGSLLKILQNAGPNRELMRKLQRHSVTLHQHQWKKLLSNRELIEENGFFLQAEASPLYHEQLGLLSDVPDYAPATLIA